MSRSRKVRARRMATTKGTADSCPQARDDAPGGALPRVLLARNQNPVRAGVAILARTVVLERRAHKLSLGEQALEAPIPEIAVFHRVLEDAVDELVGGHARVGVGRDQAHLQ